METIFPPGSSILDFNSPNSNENNPFSAFFNLKRKSLQDEEDKHHSEHGLNSDMEKSFENVQEVGIASDDTHGAVNMK